MTRLAVFAGAMTVIAFAACAEAEDGVPEGAPSENGEGGALPPAPKADASLTDAGGDADAGTHDAPPPACSKEGYCPTVVPPAQTLRGVWTDGLGVAWAVSEQGGILRWDGKAWKVHATVKGMLLCIWGSGPTDIWIGGEGGIFHSEGASSASLTFAQVALPGAETPITSIWGTGANDVWAAGGINASPLVGRLLHYAGPMDGGGDAWTLATKQKDPLWFAKVWGTPASGVWVAGTRTDPVRFWRETFVMRRAVGQADFVDVPLPSDPSLPGNPVGALEKLYDAAASNDGSSFWVLGRTHSATQAYLQAKTKDGGLTFVWTFHAHGNYSDPIKHFIGANGPNDAWIGGDYGRLHHWTGATWHQALVTVTSYPVIDPFYAMGGKGNDMWFVGEGIALHRDPSKVTP